MDGVPATVGGVSSPARFPRLSAALMVMLVLALSSGGGCSGTANRGQQQKTTADALSPQATPPVTSMTGKTVIKPQFDWARSFSEGLAAAVRVDASADLGAVRADRLTGGGCHSVRLGGEGTKGGRSVREVSLGTRRRTGAGSARGSSPRRDHGDGECRPERRLVGVPCG